MPLRPLVLAGPRLALASLLLAAAAGCRDPAGPADRVTVVTRGTRFTATDGLAVVQFTIRNAGRSAVYLDPCGGVASQVERRSGGRWEQASAAYCLYDLSTAPIRLAPSAEVDGSRGVPGPGVYRLRVGVATTASGPPDWGVTSNGFTVE